MSYALDFSSGNAPVVGVDVTMTTPSMTAKIKVTAIEFSEDGGNSEFKDGQGNTVARLWSNIEQGKRCRVDFFVIGTDEATAATNNTMLATLPRGTAVVMGSSDYPEAAGSWRADGVTLNGTQDGIATGSLNLVPELT